MPLTGRPSRAHRPDGPGHPAWRRGRPRMPL